MYGFTDENEHQNQSRMYRSLLLLNIHNVVNPMTMWNALKKLGRRKAGTWGRVNTPKQKRAASKAVRVSHRAKLINGKEIDQ